MTKRPLQPVTQTEDERKRERRFTRRMMLLAMSGCVLGVGIQAATRLAGKPVSPPPPPGVPPPPQMEPPPPRMEPPPPQMEPLRRPRRAVPPPRLRGK
jgi:hypothetical protein